MPNPRVADSQLFSDSYLSLEMLLLVCYMIILLSVSKF